MLLRLYFVFITVFADLNIPNCHKWYYSKPACSNHPDGYRCTCGPGFLWNTHICVAEGLNSAFEFHPTNDSKFVLLNDKQFPDLRAFTLSLWLKPKSGTVLSYSSNQKPNLLTISISEANHLNLKLDSSLFQIRRSYIPSQIWSHLVWTWEGRNKHKVYVNGNRIEIKGHGKDSSRSEIPGNGRLVLGQQRATNGARADEEQWVREKEFVGHVAFLNIWKKVLTLEEIVQIKEDCKLNWCGDGIEWADLRSGTRGPLRMRWPSDVPFSNDICFSGKEQADSCEKFCTVTEGAQCNAEIAENIEWPRSKANLTLVMPCPGLSYPLDYTNNSYPEQANSTRACGVEGTWQSPNVSACLSGAVSLFFKNVSNPTITSNKEDLPIKLLHEIHDLIDARSYSNPLDISTLVESFGKIVELQSKSVYDPTYTKHIRRKDSSYPKWDQTIEFFELSVEIINKLTGDRNSEGWQAAQPMGIEGDYLANTLESLVQLAVESLLFERRGDASRRKLSVKSDTFTIESNVLKRSSDFEYSELKDILSWNLIENEGTVRLSANYSDSENLIVTLVKASFGNILPTQRENKKMDKINSAVFAAFAHRKNKRLNSPITIDLHLKYLNNFNISEQKCVRLMHGPFWHWTGANCSLNSKRSSVNYAHCVCSTSGWFAVTTHMFNDNWVREEKPLELLLLPSYIGCAVSTTLCILACFLHRYVKTASQTALIHKNLAISIAFSQLTLMFSIDKLKYDTICKASTVLLHYFFISSFAWLMNEAFNLYTVITYAAHSHSESSAESSSQWRYYILGWLLPAALVGAFIGTYNKDYYSLEMCFVAWKHKWLWIGPATAMLAITVLVLIFTAKEQHESSYSKNEKTNKSIFNHSKALWSQVILLTMSWSFAFISLRMVGAIVKWLYALFNCLQGAFFFIFFSVLHDEVRTFLIAKKKQHNLSKHGYDYSPTQTDSDFCQPPVALMDVGVPSVSSPTDFQSTDDDEREGYSTLSRRKNMSKSSESECEIMVTSV
ncbi:DgyrCDS11973 [Dimorphilus gyrociliatus]|uniref:DgyrCDS11973 n=1 Tax=Dimorphilus gyrociliatus TaxID=2664684 RepID=A0A7I8W529_9ANNE|nr:DgyrCDS11973 [Dimorphilus gyrociliatus]